MEPRMHTSLLALWLLGAMVAYAASGASAQPGQTASIEPQQAGVHSAVVDMPKSSTCREPRPTPGLLCRPSGRRTALRRPAKKRKLGMIAHPPLEPIETFF